MNKLTKYIILFMLTIVFIGCSDNKNEPESKFKRGDMVMLEIGNVKGQIIKSYYNEEKWKYKVRLCRFSSHSPFLGGKNDTSPIGTEWLYEMELKNIEVMK